MSGILSHSNEILKETRQYTPKVLLFFSHEIDDVSM